MIFIDYHDLERNLKMKTTLHRNGSVTYWSVHQQRRIEKAPSVPDEELAAMSETERDRVIRHMEGN